VLDKITEIEVPRAGPGARPRFILVPDEAAEPTPVWRRWWFWTGLAVLVAAGVTAAVLSSRPDTAVPSSDLGNQGFY
jgi:hypothetical protein